MEGHHPGPPSRWLDEIINGVTIDRDLDRPLMMRGEWML
jgi:hypothetical protein